MSNSGIRPFAIGTKTFSDLARFLGSRDMISAIPLNGVTSNSSEVNPGDLFLALPGAKVHGAEFIDMAYLRGAVAVITDIEGAAINHMLLPTLVIDRPRLRAGDIAAWMYDFPFRSLFSVGITGTNGKTTTTSLLNQLWQLEKRETGLIGTVGIEIGQEHFSNRFTTPEASDVQSIVASMRDLHVSHMSMEVSSHAIDQLRIKGAFFNLVGFTNLTQDHLDYHGTMENYFSVKSRLFTFEYSERGLVNVDDPYGKRLVDLSEIPVTTLSRLDVGTDWHYTSIVPLHSGYQVSIRGVGGILIEGFLPLIGDHNLDNALMAIAAAVESGVDPLSIQANFSKLRGVPGRLEQIELGQKFRALVDYAHTPDAVERVLTTLRNSTSGRIIAVLGCGGDRDKSKRPIMGKLLLELSDIAVFTSDNPRSEDPLAILSEMTNDLLIQDPHRVDVDRKSAITYAVNSASDGDTIIVLGKGHEVGQEIAGVKYPFDDRLELASAIEHRS